MSYKTKYGYDFYFKDGDDLLIFPITPEELTIKVDSNNKVVTLINEGDINILKSPSLAEIEFEARFPMRKYPYSREPLNFEVYYKKFVELKEKKRPFRFIVARDTTAANKDYGVNYLVALETFEITESVDEGDDILVTFKLKQYKEYGIKKLSSSHIKDTASSSSSSSSSSSTSTAETPRPTEGKGTKFSVYTVKSGDCLWNIAKAAYGDSSKYKKIYSANKTAIEDDAKKHGKSSSSNGHWIWPGLKLNIPDISNASSLTVKKLW